MKVSIGMIKPLELLGQAIGKRVIVKLRGGKEYRGTLNGYDPHMNLVLMNAEEVVGDSTTEAEMVVIRGDNVIYISP